ncbi:MAG TPA: M20/M25/M40 family metallo-hydrolase [Acidobacteriaceae bacterium]|jgi:acetylornithine deacetylase/succinyl-diaminopimelate desuccinylase-like protein|nr:M20/M25/M40 family metallo-hydrolase [Acidobacteriaceae bacterium]
MMRTRFAVPTLLVSLAASGAMAQSSPTWTPPDAATKAMALDIYRQLININTTDSVGSVTAASKAMEQRFVAAGWPAADIFLGGPNDRKENLVVRYRGTGKHEPILFIGHLDVVEARRADWSTDPFQFVEKDGYYYGRGTQDMKDCDAIMVATFLRLRKEGFKPDRDLILALTADEEGGKSNGVDWLLKNHPELMKAAFAFNPDGGGVDLSNGKPVDADVDASEKLYADYQLIVTNPGGHSSLPVPDNAIYHLADGLHRLQNYTFPFELNAITRAYFEKLSTQEQGQPAADMKAMLADPPDQAAIARISAEREWNAAIRTTCVATRLLAGHANNALPGMAQANVNCRILPGHSREEIRQDLIRVIADPQITVNYVDDSGDIHPSAPDAKALPPVALQPEVMDPLEKLVAVYWPGAPLVADMAVGASDSVYTNAAGIPTYNWSAIELEPGDMRAHGKDERLPETSFWKGVQFWPQYIRMLTGN